jgi:hypothetical protein
MDRKLIAAALAGVLAASLAACAAAGIAATPHYSLAPVKSNGQELAGLDSRTILESRQPGGIVSVRADDQFAAFGASFLIAVQNKSGGAVEFGPKDIAASVNGKAVPVLTADELDAKVKAEARGYIRATSRTGTVDISNATEEATREYRFNNYGGCAAGNSGCQIRSADNGSGYRQDRLAREAEAETVADTALRLQASSALIAQKALHKMSVAPEQMGGGALVVQPPASGGPIDLTITFNGQKHRFTFSAKPVA